MPILHSDLHDKGLATAPGFGRNSVKAFPLSMLSTQGLRASPARLSFAGAGAAAAPSLRQNTRRPELKQPVKATTQREWGVPWVYC